jgi:hypothetical protein
LGAISVDVESITLGVGETATITATVKPDNATNKNVTWSTSDANVATVDNGVVTAVGKGEATITATAGGKTAETVITVLPIVTGEEAAELLDWFVGWPTLRFHSEERGNYVSYDFNLKVEKISDLSDVTVSIFKEGIKIATNTLIDPSKWSNTTGLSGSFYTNDIEETSSWYVEQISGALGEDIFDKLVLRAIYEKKVYIVDQAELRPIEGNVKNLTQYKGYGTIQAAIADAADGDVIVVQGDYEENLNITKPITLKGIESGTATIKGNIVINKTNNVTIEGLEVEATDTTTPVIHIIDSNNVNIINNTVKAQGYASIGTSTGPARVTGKISGNTVTGMIIVGTDGELEVCENDVTPTSAEGICFYPVGPEAKIIVTGNKIGQVEGDFAQIKVEQKPKSVNGKTNEVDMLSVISEDNNDATVKLAWIKTVGEDAYADYANIQAAIDAATTGDNIIAVYPGNYETDPIKIIQREGVNITLEAVGEVVLKNQIQIDGNGRSNGAESLTINGFTFDFSDKSGDIITTVKGDDQNYGYTHNVSIEDCIFIGNTQSSVVAVRASALGGHYNFRLKGCTGTNLHSLAQLTSVTGVKVQDCNVIDAIEGGLNLQNSTNIVIDNLTVDGTEYGVRAGQGSGTVNTGNTMTISDSNLNAQYPIWLRGDAPGTVTITNSVLEPTEDGQMIRDNANGKVNITIDGAAYVTTEEELRAAIADPSVSAIALGNDIEISKPLGAIGKPVKLDGNNKTIFDKTNNDNVLFLASDNIEIKHVTIKGKEDNSLVTAINIEGGIEEHTGIVIDYVTFENTGSGVYANLGGDVTITNSIFKNLDFGIGIGIGVKGKIEANEFSEIKDNYVENSSEYISSESIIADNNFDTTPTIDGINIKPAQ